MTFTDAEKELLDVNRKWRDAWNNQDIDSIYEIQGESIGYGFRTQGIRINPNPEFKQVVREWLPTMREYTLEFDDDMNVRIVGDTGIFGGSFTERIVEHDGSVRKVKVRATSTWKKIDGEWKYLMFHRDNLFNP